MITPIVTKPAASLGEYAMQICDKLVGLTEGAKEGSIDGKSVGGVVGLTVGARVGLVVIVNVGFNVMVGEEEGEVDGLTEG